MDTSRETNGTTVQSAINQSYAATYQVSPVVGTPQTSPSYEMIPHRVFVGGFQAGTTEQELRSFFEQYGDIREVKVIRNNEGSSKGYYGFVTFETEEEASAVRKLTPEKLEFKGRRLNLGPAMRRISHGNRFAEFAVASPQVYAGNGAFAYPSVIIPEGYTVAQPQPTYLVVPPTTPGYQFMSPSFAYSPATPNQQRSFVLPPTPNPTPTVPYSVQAPAYGQQAQKTPSPIKTPRSGAAKTPTRHEAKTPTRHIMGGGSASGSPATNRRAQTMSSLSSPHRQDQSTTSTTCVSQQQTGLHPMVNHQTNVLTAAQMGPGGDPMTPITPGMVTNGQQAGFRWPHNTLQQVQTTPLHPGQYYQPAAMMSTYQPTDMTHYSQMYPPAQMYQQQDCFTTEIMAAANVEANYERQALKSAFEAMKM